MVRSWSLLVILLACSVAAAAQGPPRNHHAPKDTTGNHVLPDRLAGSDTLNNSSARNDRMYDSLRVRYTRRAVPRFLYNSLFTRRDSDPFADNRVINENKIYEPYEGLEISGIYIYPLDLISSDSTWIERTANSLHAVTREKTIRHDLLFRVGDRIDPDVITKSNRNIRSRSYISDVKTTVMLDADDPGKVIVIVVTRDVWALGADARINFSGNSSVEVYDANILGYGNRLSVEQNFTWKTWDYGGTMVALDVPNWWGSYFKLHVEAGRKFDNTTLGADISKEFLFTTDYAVGASWYNRSTNTYMLYADSSSQVDSRVLELWAGKSRLIPAWRNSIYITGRYTAERFGDRPPVGPRLNPAFHKKQFTAMGAGLYREHFYTANLIFGYGYREYLAAGYRAEVVTGYLDGEFRDEWYVGGSFRAGGFGKPGYLMCGIGLGNFFPNGKRAGRGALNFEAAYFTNLWKVGPRTRIRQFANLSYLLGWNRDEGANELVSFDGGDQLRGLDTYNTGTNRARLTLETVVFTPYQPLGFRLAAFLYSDMGLLGNAPNIFANKFYSTVGLGIRLKNERLVFNALEIRIGFAAGHGGLLPCRYVTISSQNRVEQVRFAPGAPQTVSFK